MTWYPFPSLVLTVVNLKQILSVLQLHENGSYTFLLSTAEGKGKWTKPGAGKNDGKIFPFSFIPCPSQATSPLLEPRALQYVVFQKQVRAVEFPVLQELGNLPSVHTTRGRAKDYYCSYYKSLNVSFLLSNCVFTTTPTNMMHTCLIFARKMMEFGWTLEWRR